MLVHIDQLILQRRRAAVNNQNFHLCCLLYVFALPTCEDRILQIPVFIIINGNDLENFQEFVITCSTMTTAVVILCYSIFDSKRLGISNRTIIRYQIGNKTLPIAFFLSLVKLPVFKVCTYLGWKDFLLFELPYSLLIQYNRICNCRKDCYRRSDLTIFFEGYIIFLGE